MLPDPPQPIRVCCVIGALTTGGSERQMLGILQQLDRQRFRPHLYTFYRDSPLVDQIPSDVPHFCFEQQHGPLRQGWVPGRIQRDLARSLADYCIQQQIEVVYDRTYHVSLVTGAASRRSKIPYVNTVVENPAVGFYSTAGVFGRLKYYQLRSTYRRAAQVLCVSQGLARGTAQFYRLPETIFSACYSFIDSARLQAIDRAASKRTRVSSNHNSEIGLGHETRPLKIVAVGRLHWQKGLDVLMKAVAQARDDHGVLSHLTLIGDGPERNKLQELAERLGIHNDVHFAGWQLEPAILVSEADLFILPSLTEGLPNSLLEAMLVGTPAIASNCNYGPSELTDHGRWATLVPPGDPAALCQAIHSFVADPLSAIQRAMSGIEVLRSRFGPEVGCRRLEEHLAAAARRRPLR
jgi:glycosyltransferase involved in cell wall biosynthesis